MAVVIGKKASYVKAADAFDYILGYTVAQDISARDWQKEKNMGQFLLGKVCSFTPGFYKLTPGFARTFIPRAITTWTAARLGFQIIFLHLCT